MAIIYADRVKETSATTGTGTMTLDGAVAGFQTFNAAMADTDTCYYTITDGTDWEVGYGTYSSDTLARTTVIASSNSDSAVNWAGATELYITIPAAIPAATVLSSEASTDNAIARHDGTSGMVLQNSPVIIDDSGNLTGIGNIAVSGTVDGIDIATDVAANTAKISYTDAAKVSGIEASADVTDATNVTAAGALMDSEVTNLAQVKAFDTTDYATAAQGVLADSASQFDGGAYSITFNNGTATRTTVGTTQAVVPGATGDTSYTAPAGHDVTLHVVMSVMATRTAGTTLAYLTVDGTTQTPGTYLSYTTWQVQTINYTIDVDAGDTVTLGIKWRGTSGTHTITNANTDAIYPCDITYTDHKR